MEIERFVDQRRMKVERFFAEHREAISRQGVVVPTYRFRDGRRRGPYYRLSCRVNRRQIAVYLGSDEELIRFARDELSRLQIGRRVRMQMAQVRQKLRRHARLARLSLDVQLKPLGLHRKGNEVRGWHSSKTAEAVAMPDSLSHATDVAAFHSEP